jgi:hypothetical protein
MASKDLASKLDVDTRIASGSTIVDTAGSESITFLLPASTTTSIALTHGDNSALSDTAAVPAASLVGAVSGFGATDHATVGYVGKKRYVMITVTNPVTNTSIMCVKSDLRLAPPA